MGLGILAPNFTEIGCAGDLLQAEGQECGVLAKQVSACLFLYMFLIFGWHTWHPLGRFMLGRQTSES